jgi:dipeptidyl aminopeptidase/acylaminoacyl peptidase
MSHPRYTALTAAALALVATAPVASATAQQRASAATADSGATRLATPAAGAARDLVTLEGYLDLEDVQDPQLSPDGRQVVYTRRFVDRMNDRWDSALWIMNADGSRNRFLTKGSSARWSKDGTRLAYFAQGEPNSSTQLFVRYMDAEGATSQVTRVDQTPSDLEWAPDGKSIAFRMLVLSKDNWKIPMPTPPKGAKWTEAPRVVTRVTYRADRQGYVDDGYKHIFVVPADGGTPRQVTDGDWEDGAPHWTPDSRTIVFDGYRSVDAPYDPRESEIYAVDVAAAGNSASSVRRLTQHPGPDDHPVVSPNGREIAFTAFDSTDDTWRDATLYVMNADGTGRRALTAALDRTPVGLLWAKDGSGIYFNVESEGQRNLYFAPLAGGAARPVTKGTQVLTVTSLGPTGTAVGVRSTSLEPADVVTVSLRDGATHRVTAVNDDLLAGKTLGKVEEIWYPSEGGMRIQGWIVKPPHFDASKKYPLMLVIHGGPHSMYNSAFNYAYQEHAANGYVILYTNPRGSTGYGSKFGNAIKNAYPGKDFDDLMAGVDTIVGRGYVDPKRMYVYGCSGGGVLTSWIVGHTDRFAAASANCPVTNWLSFVAITDGPNYWYRNFAKFPWEDPSEHLRRSPLMYVGNVKTPTMLMTGVNDLRTPISQTEEFYEALKMRKVPTAMIRFNDEWHGTSSKPSNYLRTQLYLRSWFEKWGAKDSGDKVAGR